MPTPVPLLPLLPLTAEAFAPFGDVLETQGHHAFPINGGKVQRFHDLAQVDVEEMGGRAGISLFVAQPYDMPLSLAYVERHPLASQAFIPLDDTPFIVVVSAPHTIPTRDSLHAFVTNGRQGVNYARGVWHHVLIATGLHQTFAVVDRIGPGSNCDRFELSEDAACAVHYGLALS